MGLFVKRRTCRTSSVNNTRPADHENCRKRSWKIRQEIRNDSLLLSTRHSRQAKGQSEEGNEAAVVRMTFNCRSRGEGKKNSNERKGERNRVRDSFSDEQLIMRWIKEIRMVLPSKMMKGKSKWGKREEEKWGGGGKRKFPAEKLSLLLGNKTWFENEEPESNTISTAAAGTAGYR